LESTNFVNYYDFTSQVDILNCILNENDVYHATYPENLIEKDDQKSEQTT
jgi:hypothetical protein